MITCFIYVLHCLSICFWNRGCNSEPQSAALLSVGLGDSPAATVTLHIFPSISRRAKEVRRRSSRNHPQEPPAQTRPVGSPSSRLLHPASCPSGRFWLRPELQCLVCVQQPVERQRSQRSLPTLSAWVTLSPHISYKLGLYLFTT